MKTIKSEDLVPTSIISEQAKVAAGNLDLQKEIAALNKEAAILRAIASTVQMVVHDVRQPLDMVTKLVRRLVMQAGKSTLSYSHYELQIIESATRNVYGMLDDLLSFSPNSRVLVPETVDIAAFFQEILAEFSEAKVCLTIEGQSHQSFDRHKMSRVIFNVVKNAIEATRGNGTYWINIDSAAKILHIEIGNLDSKISQDHLSMVFDSFFTSDKATGRGLGTAIAKKFTEEHGGEIWCESNGWSSKGCQVPLKGNGDYVIFVIRIPVSSNKVKHSYGE